MSLLTTPRVIRDISALEHYTHSRWRVYPQVVSNFALLTAGTPADNFGSWVQIIPINTVPFAFDVIGLVIEDVSAPSTYHIQLGYSTTADPPGYNYEAGERRVRVAITKDNMYELLAIQSQNIPANSSVWGRLKTASGDEDTAEVSIVLSRHVEVSHPRPKWPAFPW